MKARCKCGHIFDVTPDLEGKRVRCPRCSKVVRLPTSARPAPPSSEKEEKAGEFEFDWGEEFSLEGEEAPKMGAAPAPEAGEEAGPEKEQPRTPGLEFDSEEFHLDLGEQAQQGQEGEPIELGPGQILGVREGTPGRGPADAAAPAGEARVCSHCGRVVVEEVAACPECGTPLGAPAGVRRAPVSAKWAGSFWGSFAYAYPAVLAGDGWQAWLKYAFIGAFVPNIVILIGAFTCLGICVAIPLALAILFGSILGGMYLYMSQAAARGPEPLEQVKPRIMDDMVVPFILIAASSAVLVIAPIVAAAVVAEATGALPLDELRAAIREGGEPLGVDQILSIVTTSAVLLAGILFGLFCFPMVVMLLGASQQILKSLNPVNVFKAIIRAPAQYFALWVFFMLNVAFTQLLLHVAEGQFASLRQSLIGSLVVNFITMAFSVYMASATGWRMGMFLYRNEHVFDHVRGR